MATDVFVGPLPPAPDATTLETVKPAIVGDAKPPLGEAEAPGADDSTSSAFRYDVNDDGIVSPIDVLIVVNAINELRAGHGISEEAFTAYDVNRDRVISADEIDRVVEQLDILGRAPGQDTNSSAQGCDLV